MKINLYQIQYNENTAAKKDSGLLTFDCRENPEFLKREIAHLIRFYDEVVVHADEDDYFGLFSPKFEQKTGLQIQQVREFILNNPEQDIYLFNPFPMLVYRHINVWEQAELMHKGILSIMKKMVEMLNYDFDVEKLHRHNYKQVIYCNYWVAKKSAFDQIVFFLKKFDNIVKTDSEINSQIFNYTTYVDSRVCFYPFVFERLVSSFLLLNKKIKVLPYEYTEGFKGQYALNRIERKFYQHPLRNRFNNWEINEASNITEIEMKLKIIHDFIYPKHNLKFMRSLTKKVNLFRFKSLEEKLNLPHD